ncbi:MAG: hypothetical protein GWN84_00955 [Gammaproteobacteria bacterium]|nr:hypothetical protein [Gammaproteobacteria bacterium]NIR81765.1 hypothetical protein [Gammaproteobacteria bacterium]NIR88568.1 hypothetical protein [Gammaproteobacteria bacterium]NIU02872.1 hypothetical protein [Gammaproteobacteria bacterium]NIV50394.1 hypothetical protein [Gammaproteobacteria bacterium]
MDFIFMLTRQDQTIEDCLEVFEAVAPLGLRHLGFKDIGVETETLVELNRRIQDAGATSYMEVVSTTPESCLDSARAAVGVGVDCLLGGTDVEATLEILKGRDIAYYPFAGIPEGHPTRLRGDRTRIAHDCAAFMHRGCAGVDLLAFRATEDHPLALIRAAREGLGSGRLIVAGSIDSPATVRRVAEAGADAFTIGSAVFDGSFSPRKGCIRSQLRDVLAACA